MYYRDATNIIRDKDALILGIESSCDETAASVVKGGRKVLSSVIISSAGEQAKYGGVVPEIASRAHTKAISQAVKRAIEEAGVEFSDLSAIAVTYGAGLLGALLVGVSYAKALAFALGIPLVGVSHIRGHMAAAYLEDETLAPPYVMLLASGGHTAIMVVEDYLKSTLLGGTMDDAAGEAFDKVARILKLPYPGGPNIERLATGGRNIVQLPKMLKNQGGYNFSYSGLKTAVINYVHTKEQKGEAVNAADVACSFQHSALDILADKAIEACAQYGLSTIAIGGGVAANGYLREYLTKRCEEENIKLVLPKKVNCTDNAAMIAAEGYIQYLSGNFSDLTLNAKASVPLK